MWFYFDGACLVVYSMPNAAKVRHIQNNPRVSLNLDSNGNGAGVIVVGGEARVDTENFDPRADSAFWAKYKGDAERFGLTEGYAAYSTRLRVGIDKVWTTPA